jgi:hypothetical protein
MTRKFVSYYGFHLSVVISLVINECMCYYHQVTKNGDLISFKVAYLIYSTSCHRSKCSILFILNLFCGIFFY